MLQLYKLKKDDTGAYVRDGSAIKTDIVNNKYTDSDNDQPGTKPLYNVPTLTTGDRDYGTYEIEIQTAAGQNYQLDGIRVYNPYKDNTASFTKVRDILLDTESGSVDLNTEQNGALFVDTKGERTPEAWSTDYKNFGPKNEVYLKPGQLVAFKIDGYTAGKVVAIGLSAPETGSGSFSINEETTTTTLSSTTDMYYSVTPNENGIVVVKNPNNATSLISITNVKVTTGSAAVPGSVSFVYDKDVLDYVTRLETAPKQTWTNAAVTQPTLMAQLWTLLERSLTSLFRGLGQW